LDIFVSVIEGSRYFQDKNKNSATLIYFMQAFGEVSAANNFMIVPAVSLNV